MKVNPLEMNEIHVLRMINFVEKYLEEWQVKWEFDEKYN